MSYIELDKSPVEVYNRLNVLLANYQIYYQNMRGFHWNVKGENFFELHVKFEEFYTVAADKIDEVAERILTLGGTPLHTFNDYIEISSIEVVKNLQDGKQIMEHVWNMHNTLLSIMRDAVKIASEQDDDGSQDMLSPMISELEKTNWMVGSWLRK